MVDKMNGSVLMAIAAAVGNLLQGWDNATIAGALFYIRKELNLETAPTMEGLIVAMSLIGATAITTFSGPLSDAIGRRPMLIISAVLYVLSGVVMFWAPNIYILLIARLIVGFGTGLTVTIVSTYISETAPSDIRGTLNTLPQFMGSVGMLVSYCVVFGMSLMDSPSWRLMLGMLVVPSVVYLFLMVMFLPESPRWLVSKGRMVEAKQVLQRLRGKEDVSGEMALLVEGLSVGDDTLIEEYLITSANDLPNIHEDEPEKDKITMYSAEDGVPLIAEPVTGQSMLGAVSRQGSMVNQGSIRVDPVVTLFGSVHGNLPENQGSMFFPTWGSMVNITDQDKSGVWVSDSQHREGDHHPYDASGAESDDNLKSPLLSRSGTNTEKDDMGVGPSRNFSNIMQHGSSTRVNVMGIGGGWQLAYKSSDGKGEDGLKRIYLLQEGGTAGGRQGSIMSLTGGSDFPGDGGPVHASALVSKSVIRNQDLHLALGVKMVQPSEAAVKGPSLRDFLEPGVKHALVVGIVLQALQQFSGISGVMYYTPSILKQAGVGVLLSNLGLRPDSASLLISAFTTLLMLPTIGLAMRLMDIAGRRWLMLSTLPILLIALVILVLSTLIPLGPTLYAIISTLGVIVYICCFVMGFGPIPNILCSEIFPTRVRGVCIAICALTYWITDIIVTYSLPVMLSYMGLGGVFGVFAIFCAISLVFVYLKVPETKGMPLEVITEFFAVGAKQAADGTVKV